MCQVRVLSKEPKGKEVEDNDHFAFNAAFSERLYRIRARFWPFPVVSRSLASLS